MSEELRSERLDLRLTKTEKRKLLAKAKATGCTVTSIISEMIAQFK
jgi:uncharacterized protein (DUF1778 family)